MPQNNNFWKNLEVLISGQSVRPEFQQVGGLGLTQPDPVLYTTNDRVDLANTIQDYSQQKYLSHTWVKARQDNAIDSLAGQTATRLMFRDADLMDGMPEIGAALDIIAEEACANDSRGQMLHIYSSSKRIKSVLEDLFTNRLNINIILPQIVRGMVKYGNHYMLLNIDKKDGIRGWMKMPVYEMERVESGYGSMNGATVLTANGNNMANDEVKFVWTGHNEGKPYFSWQMAHFRDLTDSFFLPYGVSVLHKCRRAWRMWSMMEDLMLVYRQERSVERRVFKVYVGLIDDEDVPAYVQQVANNFKRTPIIDPSTGQIDLRRNFLHGTEDIFIPVRSEDAPTPIETLASQTNQTAIDDIQYQQNKVFAGLRVPKTFLNFQEAQGKGQNLSLLDVRFCRMINKKQQYVLTELYKVAMIHLYLLGFEDDITNFSLTLTNPSAQIEALELEDLTKRIQTAAAALADPGTGIPIMSQHRVLKEIMKMTDDEIRDMFNEIRIEKAMAAELQNTANVIKKTHVFDKVDRIYGDVNVLNQPTGEGGGPEGGAGGGPGGMNVDMGDSLQSDSLGGGAGDMDSGMSGTPSEVPMSDAPAADAGGPVGEGLVDRYTGRIRLDEAKRLVEKSFFEQYMDILEGSAIKEEKKRESVADYIGKNTSILNENIKKEAQRLDEITGKADSEVEALVAEIKKIRTEE